MANVTLDDIDAAEGAVKNVRVKLQTIGREIYRMRGGEELGPQYGFDQYHRENYAGSHYVNQEGPDWGVGTPILALVYYWPRGEDHITVTLPQHYLTGVDWRALEQARIDAERHAEAERQNAATEEASREREDRERKTYERLKAKYECAALQQGSGQ